MTDEQRDAELWELQKRTSALKTALLAVIFAQQSEVKKKLRECSEVLALKKMSGDFGDSWSFGIDTDLIPDHRSEVAQMVIDILEIGTREGEPG